MSDDQQPVEEARTASVDDGMGGSIEVDQGDSRDPFQEWASSQPEDVQQRIENAGIRDFDHLARTWGGAEEARQRMQSERDKLMSQIGQPAQETYDYSDDDDDGRQVPESMSLPSMDELLPMFGYDEAKVIDFVVSQRSQEIAAQQRAEFQSMLEEYLGPIQQQQSEAQLNEAITEIRNTYGEDFDSLAPDVVGIINSRPDLYDSPQGVWAAFGLAQASRQREAYIQNQARANAGTLQGSSSHHEPPRDQAADIITRMMNAGPVTGADGL